MLFRSEVMDVFYRPELGGIIVENVDMDGNLVDCFEGRQVTPGHAIEAMWFIMDLGKRLNRPKLIEKAKPKIKPCCRLKIPWEYISSVRGFVTAVQALEL